MSISDAFVKTLNFEIGPISPQKVIYVLFGPYILVAKSLYKSFTVHISGRERKSICGQSVSPFLETNSYTLTVSQSISGKEVDVYGLSVSPFLEKTLTCGPSASPSLKTLPYVWTADQSISGKNGQ